MQLDFWTVFGNIVMLLALGIPGYFLVKRKMVPSNAITTLIQLLLYVTLPFLVIKGFLMKEYDPSLLPNLGWALLFALIAHFLWLGMAMVIFPAKGTHQREHRVDQFAVMFTNATFIGIPIIMSLFATHPEALLYISMFVIVFNALMWTLGCYVLTGEKRYMNVKKIIFNPPTLALFVALPLFFFKVPIDLNGVVFKGISFLGDMTAPLSMIILGMRYADLPPLSVFMGVRTYLVSFLRLIVSPILLFFVMILFTRDATLISTLYILAALPVAGSTVLFAEKFQGDLPESVRTNLNSTLLAILTFPIMVMILQALFRLFEITF